MQNQPLDSKIRYRAMAYHLLGLAWMPMMVPTIFIFYLIPIPSGGRGDWILALFIVFTVLPLVSMVLTTALVLAFWQFSRNNKVADQ